MPRFSKRQPSNAVPQKGELHSLVREAEKEVAKWTEVAKSTRISYESKAATLAKGWNLGTACKKTRYAMKAAGLWTMRKQLKALLKHAKKVQKNGETGAELFMVREAQYAREMEKVRQKLAAIREFEALPWQEVHHPKLRLEAPHKKAPATDAELVAFYDRAKTSIYREAFLVAEFCGCRGEEFGEGVRVELVAKKGQLMLVFHIQSAKADGKKKGIDLRAVEVPFPADAEPPVQERWQELAKGVHKGGKAHVVRIAATEKSSAGELFTNACKTISKSAKVKVAAYSLRNRYSAQVKQANPGDAVAVALALGHQTTETQRHYARASRGGGGVSPVQSTGVNVSGAKIRGAPKRTGPPLHVKQKTILNATTPKTAPPARSRGPRL